MSSSYCWKLRALLKKNLILMKRNLISTIFEILFPILIIIVIVALKQAFSVDTHHFLETEGSLEKFILDKSMSSFNYENEPTSDYDGTAQTWLGLSALPPFAICSPLNPQYQYRPLIASIGIPQEIKNQMIHDSELFENVIQFKLTANSFKEFQSIEELENYIKDPSYIKEPSQQICFGLKFVKENEKYKYSLHFFDFEKTGIEGVEDIPNNKEGMFDPFQSGPDLNSYM